MLYKSYSMNKTTTQDLLNYAYNETGLCDSDRIQRAIDGDPIVAGEYKEITEVIGTLNAAVPGPSDATIARILEFAR